MVIKYKSYGKMPKKLYGIDGSFWNKPKGGLWGCRGEEWREWCELEQFHLEKLKHHFYFKMKKGSKVYRIKTVKDFQYLLDNFGVLATGGLQIDYSQVQKQYDAVEVVGDIVYKLRFGTKDSHMGLYVWDVPSICVLNVDKVKLCKE